jgi:hypothetical protein
VFYEAAMATVTEVAREWFPTVADEMLDAIIWGETGFPHFWPDGNLTPEQNFRLQLAEAAGVEVSKILDT